VRRFERLTRRATAAATAKARWGRRHWTRLLFCLLLLLFVLTRFGDQRLIFVFCFESFLIGVSNLRQTGIAAASDGGAIVRGSCVCCCESISISSPFALC
jgi:hypothetical protein